MTTNDDDDDDERLKTMEDSVTDISSSTSPSCRSLLPRLTSSSRCVLSDFWLDKYEECRKESLADARPSPQHILRLLNTNVKGGGKVGIALTEIKGVGRRYANLVCKKADVDLNKR